MHVGVDGHRRGPHDGEIRREVDGIVRVHRRDHRRERHALAHEGGSADPVGGRERRAENDARHAGEACEIVHALHDDGRSAATEDEAGQDLRPDPLARHDHRWPQCFPRDRPLLPHTRG